jgi:hypothetical protein
MFNPAEENMSYKVFFVEDEIITREGIRDNADWQVGGGLLLVGVALYDLSQNWELLQLFFRNRV